MNNPIAILAPFRRLLLATFFILLASLAEAVAQPEIMPWGNIRSFHVDGEKMVFETSVRSVKSDWSGCISSERCNWQGSQTYSVAGNTTTMSHFLQALPLNYAEKFTETSSNSVQVEVTLEATADFDQAGAYFCFEIPGPDFVGGTLTVFSQNTTNGVVTLQATVPNGKTEYLRQPGNGVRVQTLQREYEVVADATCEILVRQNHIDRPAGLNDPLPAKQFVDKDPDQPVAPYQVYFTLMNGPARKGDKKTALFTINVNGKVDQHDVRIDLDPTKPGRPFQGVGSNYRVENLKRDSAVVDFCLKGIRVSWGRIAFDWKEWQPSENESPLKNARAKKLSQSFYDQIQVAQTLARKHIPVIVTIWSPPGWAIDETRHNRQGLEHDTKLSLNAKKIDGICASIADYLEYLKNDFGIQTPLFSFNEVDYGVMVYHTPEEHAFYARNIGRYFASRGLATKILLGDTGAGTIRANKIVIPAVEDLSIHEYIGAVGFHTWHGCTPSDLKAWASSAQRLNVPLLVTEGGPNSAQHRYPQHFLDRWFQLSEIDLYIRICKYAQPLTIMEWQLTPDYSVLIGDGLYGDNGPLRPTQRYWNLKQLGSTPEDSFAIPVEVDRPNITAAAFADILHGWYTLHVVNNGAARKAILHGLPSSVNSLEVYRTDFNRGMQQGDRIQVKDGVAEVNLDSACYTTLSNAELGQK